MEPSIVAPTTPSSSDWRGGATLSGLKPFISCAMSPNVWPPLGADAPTVHFSKKARNKVHRLTEEGGGEQKTLCG